MGINFWLIVLMILISSTGCGLLFHMSMKNMEELKNRFTVVLILSLLFTPGGAWFISSLYRLNIVMSNLRKKKAY